MVGETKTDRIKANNYTSKLGELARYWQGIWIFPSFLAINASILYLGLNMKPSLEESTVMQYADINHDGKITNQERSEFWQRFAQKNDLVYLIESKNSTPEFWKNGKRIYYENLQTMLISYHE